MKKFNNISRRITIFIIIFAAIAVIFPPLKGYAENSDKIKIEITLKTPIEYTSITSKPTDEDREEAVAQLKLMSQAAIDALIMDDPLMTMWMDIENSIVQFAPTPTRRGTLYVWKINKVTYVVSPLPEYKNPKGMIDEANNIIAKFTPAGETMYDKVKSIHDYICGINSYNLKASHAYSVYGTLIDGKSVCEGYAESFKLICDKNGIDCILVVGDGITSAGSEPHMWNYVRMDDGEWYAVDLTWDDGTKILDTYFLVGSDTVVNKTTQKTFRQNHECTGDISRTGGKIFEYPVLSNQSYIENHKPEESTDSSATSGTVPSDSSSLAPVPPGGTSGSESGAAVVSVLESTAAADFLTYEAVLGKDYFSKQLSEEMMRFYEKLVSIEPPSESAATATSSPPQTPESTDTASPPVTSNKPPKVTQTAPPSDSADTSIDTITDTDDELTTLTDDSLDDIDGTPQITDSATITFAPQSEYPITNISTTENPYVIDIKAVFRVIVTVLAILSLFMFVVVIVIKFSRSEK